ncbi:hypothetical protein ACWEK5_47090 [Rhodococcus koreensis]
MTVLKQAKKNDPPCLLATMVVLGALAAVPMSAVATPAAAAPVSGIVQVDRDWQQPRGWDEDQDEDQDEQQEENELNPFGFGLFGEAIPFGDMFGGLFGGSNPFGGLFGQSIPFGDMFGSS